MRDGELHHTLCSEAGLSERIHHPQRLMGIQKTNGRDKGRLDRGLKWENEE